MPCAICQLADNFLTESCFSVSARLIGKQRRAALRRFAVAQNVTNS
jgi:hypothetical protein